MRINFTLLLIGLANILFAQENNLNNTEKILKESTQILNFIFEQGKSDFIIDTLNNSPTNRTISYELYNICFNNSKDTSFTIIANEFSNDFMNDYSKKVSINIDLHGKTIEKYEDNNFNGLDFYSEREIIVLDLDMGLRYNLIKNRKDGDRYYLKVLHQYKNRLNSISKSLKTHNTQAKTTSKAHQ